MTQPYKITIDGPGLSMVIENLAKAVCDQIIVFAVTGANAPPSGNAPVLPFGGADQVTQNPASIPRQGQPALSLREFLNDVGPKRGPDKITAIAMYLKDNSGKDVVSSADLQEAFESASEPVPGNLGRDIKWTVKTGWIAPKSDAKGCYYITQTGRSAVEKKFPPELTKKTKLGTPVRRAKKSANGDTAQ